MKNKKNNEPLDFIISEYDLIKKESGTTLVNQLFRHISEAISAQKLVNGMRMPSVRQLAESCNISRDTVVRAYDKLVAHGMLESRKGAGFYIRPKISRHALPLRDKNPGRVSSDEKLAGIRLKMNLMNPPFGLLSNTGSGYLPESWMNETAIAQELRAVARSNQRFLSMPGDPQGYLPLRNQLQMKLHDMGIGVEASNLILTNGAMDALNLVIQLFLTSPGEDVMVETPCQPLLINRLLSNGLSTIDIPRRSEGPDLEVLRKACEKYRPKFFFCHSVLHNPTGTHIAPSVAFQLLQLAEEYDFTIVEDDTYSDLLPLGLTTTPTRLAPLDQLRRVIYIGSFSKTLPPGLRVGYIAANTENIQWLTVNKTLSTIAGNSLAERTVYRLLTQGNYRHHCEKIRSNLNIIRPAAAEILRSLGMKIDYEPDAGYFIWADIGEGKDSFELATRLLAKGHLVAPGTLFSVTHKSFMRFNCINLNSPGFIDDLKQEIEAL